MRNPLRPQTFRFDRFAVPLNSVAEHHGLRPPPEPGAAPRPDALRSDPAVLLGGGAGADIELYQAELARAARSSWAGLPGADVTAAVEAGQLSAAASTAQPTAAPDGDSAAAEVAARVGTAAGVVQRQGLPPGATGPVEWRGFGHVIPVLAGSPGAGASVLAAVLADALQLASVRTLLVDAADPARSGLAMAARSDGPVAPGPHPQVQIRYSWRAQALLARLHTPLPVLAPGMVPPPRFWRQAGTEADATVADLGHDGWRLTANPLTGAGAWLRRGTPVTRPVLVVRATRPSLIHAEQVLARLDPWVAAGAAAALAQLVVMGAKRWPAGVSGAAGRRVTALMNNAVFVPRDPALAVSGITADVTPPRLRSAVTPLLRGWGLLPANDAHRTRRR